MKSVVLTVGPPRSGTTLVGQILRTHPLFLVADNSRSIQSVLLQGRALKPQIRSALITSLFQEQFGSDFLKGRSWERWQPQWIPKNSEKVIHKPRVVKKLLNPDTRLVIKKSGTHSRLYSLKPNEFSHMLATLGGTGIYVSRDTQSAAISLLKSHPHEVSNLKEAIEKISSAKKAVEKMRQDSKLNVIQVRFEDLMTTPSKTIAELFWNLGVLTDAPTIARASQLINPRDRALGSD